VWRIPPSPPRAAFTREASPPLARVNHRACGRVNYLPKARASEEGSAAPGLCAPHDTA